MKKQVIFIRGGETFANEEDFYKYISTVDLDFFNQRRTWRDWIIWALSETHDILVPHMPCKDNADYKAWKILFDRYLDFIKDESPILVGNSLGSTFLLKYLSENGFPKKISQLHLVAPVVTDEGSTLYLEKLSTFAFDVSGLSKISDICDNIHLWHSEDDPAVNFKNSEIVKEKLSKANLHVFKNRGHFGQPSFIELLESINKAN